MVTLLQDEQASLKLKLGSSDVHAHQSDLSHTRIIVSRSHAGDVRKTAQEAFGEEAKVTPAGGAGFKVYLVLFFAQFSEKKPSLQSVESNSIQ